MQPIDIDGILPIFIRCHRVGVVMESDRCFYERRLREELWRAEHEPTAELRALHAGWAELYKERIARMVSQLSVPA